MGDKPSKVSETTAAAVPTKMPKKTFLLCLDKELSKSVTSLNNNFIGDIEDEVALTVNKLKKPGENVKLKLEETLKKAKAVVVLMSSRSAEFLNNGRGSDCIPDPLNEDSHGTREVLENFFHHEIGNTNSKLLLVSLDNANVELPKCLDGFENVVKVALKSDDQETNGYDDISEHLNAFS
uniref:Uncharacterized protein n=2 Tax=Clytia hemisphaerica TaxID=252671 RepID=A0A7M5TT55_9CNID